MSQSRRRSGKRNSNVKPWRRSAAAIALLAGLTAAQTLQAQTTPPPAGTSAFAPNRILALPRAGMPDAALAKILSDNGGGKARRIGKTDLRIIDVAAGQERAMVERLKANPHFKFAELDRYVPPAFVPNDPYYGSEWHLATIGASSAWDVSQGAGIVVAVLDTGVNTHPDLTANLVPGWNVFNNNSNTSDFMGHGTPVAGTVAAITNNGTGVAGVAGQAKIMPLVVTDSTGGSYYSVIAQALTYAADNGARVANASFSGLPYSSTVQNAAQYMKNKGGLVVVAVGNTGALDTADPQTTTMIPVSSTEPNDTLSTWSSYGQTVAMSAPGDNIYSTYWTGGYGIFNGTSFASPVVAGTIALMMAANPALPSTQVESILYQTAVDLGAAGRDIYFGYGRVNAAAAVAAAAAAVPSTTTTDTTPPTVAISAPLASSTVSGLVPVNINASDNVGVAKVELYVNGSLYATDTSSPFGFSWDSTKVANGMVNLTATAYDAAGNTASSTVAVNVSNATATSDTTPPTVTILSPTLSSKLSGTVTVSASASDNLGSAGITMTLSINSKTVASSTGGSLSYQWNTKPLKSGTYTLTVVAKDAAGNTSTASEQLVK